MRLTLFLLLVALTYNSVVSSSKGLMQAKTLDADSPRRLSNGARRKLRDGVVEADVADMEERSIPTPLTIEGKINVDGLTLENLNKKLGELKKTTTDSSTTDVNTFFDRVFSKKSPVDSKPETPVPVEGLKNSPPSKEEEKAKSIEPKEDSKPITEPPPQPIKELSREEVARPGQVVPEKPKPETPVPVEGPKNSPPSKEAVKANPSKPLNEPKEVPKPITKPLPQPTKEPPKKDVARPGQVFSPGKVKPGTPIEGPKNLPPSKEAVKANPTKPLNEPKKDPKPITKPLQQPTKEPPKKEVQRPKPSGMIRKGK